MIRTPDRSMYSFSRWCTIPWLHSPPSSSPAFTVSRAVDARRRRGSRRRAGIHLSGLSSVRHKISYCTLFQAIIATRVARDRSHATGTRDAADADADADARAAPPPRRRHGLRRARRPDHRRRPAQAIHPPPERPRPRRGKISHRRPRRPTRARATVSRGRDTRRDRAVSTEHAVRRADDDDETVSEREKGRSMCNINSFIHSFTRSILSTHGDAREPRARVHLAKREEKKHSIDRARHVVHGGETDRVQSGGGVRAV